VGFITPLGLDSPPRIDTEAGFFCELVKSLTTSVELVEKVLACSGMTKPMRRSISRYICYEIMIVAVQVEKVSHCTKSKLQNSFQARNLKIHSFLFGHHSSCESPPQGSSASRYWGHLESRVDAANFQPLLTQRHVVRNTRAAFAKRNRPY
jgi:hypothetical protein